MLWVVSKIFVGVSGRKSCSFMYTETLDFILCFKYLSTDSFLTVGVLRGLRWNMFLFHAYKGGISCYSLKGSVWSEISTSLTKFLVTGKSSSKSSRKCLDGYPFSRWLDLPFKFDRVVRKYVSLLQVNSAIKLPMTSMADFRWMLINVENLLQSHGSIGAFINFLGRLFVFIKFYGTFSIKEVKSSRL